MSYLLDTNLCIQFLNGRSVRVKECTASVPVNQISVCSVVKAEFFFGAMKSRNPPQTLERQQDFLALFPSFPFDDVAAMVYGDIRVRLSREGRVIGPNDLMIAAIALANQRILVTHNVYEFSRVKGLAIEDWET